jgi:hypothetical protein
VAADLIFTSPPYNLGGKAPRKDGFRKLGAVDRLLWGDRPVKPQSGGWRSKYVCPEDGHAAWARPGLRLHCAEHAGGDSGRMIEITPTPA